MAKPTKPAIRRQRECKPQLGIWWWFRGQLMHFAQDAESVPAVEGFRDSDFAHLDSWDELKAKDRRLVHLAYDEVPRGRVLQAGPDYCMFLGHKERQNKKLLGAIRKAFGLSQCRVRIIVDEHYTTSCPGTEATLIADDDSDVLPRLT